MFSKEVRSLIAKDKLRRYLTSAGASRVKPSIEFLMSTSEEEGFCIACGEMQEGVEPNARKCTCESCGEATVYGRDEVVMMGLTY